MHKCAGVHEAMTTMTEVKTKASEQHIEHGSCIVFDGYEQGPSIKDHEHLRRVKKVCANIQLSESMEAYKNQEVFQMKKKQTPIIHNID